MAFSQVVDDSWASGTRTSPPNDAGWWYSTGSTAIEVGTGFLGLVSGGSGRGIHGTFAPVSLNIGDSIRATFAFTTPVTVGAAVDAGFRMGLFKNNGTSLATDITASSGSPSTLWQGVAGYMFDADVRNDGAGDLAIRERQLQADANTGRLLGTTSAFNSLGNGGSTFSISASTAYIGEYTILRTGTDSVSITATLSLDGGGVISTFSTSDDSTTGVAGAPTTFDFDAIGFHVNSFTFGSSSTVGAADNGIDFTNVKVELIVPEPTTFALAGLGIAAMLIIRRRA
jgi:hypothetical protein